MYKSKRKYRLNHSKISHCTTAHLKSQVPYDSSLLSLDQGQVMLYLHQSQILIVWVYVLTPTKNMVAPIGMAFKGNKG